MREVFTEKVTFAEKRDYSESSSGLPFTVAVSDVCCSSGERGGGGEGACYGTPEIKAAEKGSLFDSHCQHACPS